jgi:hypothetical protein
MHIDLSGAISADRACCCPAKPVVVAIIPPGPGRPRPADLLLCAITTPCGQPVPRADMSPRNRQKARALGLTSGSGR